MTLRETAEKVLAVYTARAETDDEVRKLAEQNGFTLEQVLSELVLTGESNDVPYVRLA